MQLVHYVIDASQGIMLMLSKGPEQFDASSAHVL